MPDNTPNKTIPRLILDALVSAPVALALDLSLKNILKVSADKAAEIGQAKLKRQDEIAERRREVLRDMLLMPSNDTKNLWKRYARADKNLQENRFIELLVEALRCEGVERPVLLKALNDLDEKRFKYAMGMIDDDWFMEWWQRTRRNGGRIAQKDAEDLQKFLKRGFKKISQATTDAARAIDQGTDSILESVGEFLGRVADDMEGSR